jgi:Leucine-rich repeat (LRR) protein
MYKRTTLPSSESINNAIPIIKKCIENKEPILNLGNLGLTDISFLSNYDLSHLHELWCHNNYITHVCDPSKLPPNLDELCVHHNDIVVLPDLLPFSIKTLCLKRNKLEILPDFLPPNLINIYAQHNDIKYLPPIENIPSTLKVLNLVNNNNIKSNLYDYGDIIVTKKLKNIHTHL